MPTFDPQELAHWSGGCWSTDRVSAATGVTLDSRTLENLDLFVALRGEQVDGHDYVAEALHAGAAGALVSHEFAASHPSLHPLLAVDDVASGLMQLARGYRDRLPCTMIGITGSVGKTTVKELLADMLSRKAKTARTPGNWNNDLGLPLSLLSAETDTVYGVFEVGMNQPGEIAALSAVLQPSHAIITPIGPAHMEAFSSEREVAEEKADLVRQVQRSGVVVLSQDEDWFQLLAKATSAQVVTTSMYKSADFSRYIDSTDTHALFVRERDRDVKQLAMNQPGDFFKADLLLAVAMARTLEVPWNDIQQAAKDYRPLEMRWQVEEVGGVIVVNDAYNANPMSMRQALLAYREVESSGSRWLVVGTMLELGDNAERHHIELGGRAATVPNVRLLAVGDWAHAVVNAARLAGLRPEHAVVCTSIEDAVDRLCHSVRSGDTLLVKASRGEKFEQVVEGWKHSLADSAGCSSEC